MRKNNHALVSEAVREYLGQRGLERRIAQAEVVNEWAALVGPRFAAVTTPLSVDAAGTLWVRVQTATWMQELHLMSREIIRELGQRGRTITSIRWVAGDETPPPRAGHGRRPSGRPSPTT